MNGGSFYHSLERDLNFFIIWENGRHQEKEISQLLRKRFSLLYAAEITWSQRHVARNFSRLYDQPGIEKAQKANNVGDGPFAVYVVCDESPQYKYDKSVSGDIEIVNAKVAHSKAEFRNLLDGKFLVHSSNNVREFFEQMVLLVGPRTLEKILETSTWDGAIHPISNDLVGANGWSSFEEMFSVLHYSSNYLVLRNFECLPDKFFGSGEKDIDFLCDRLFRFTAATNATKRGRPDKLSAYSLRVAGHDIPIDVRYVGDGYYDEQWQCLMLSRKTLHNGQVYVPRTDDLFFSLLYHAKIQKREVKEEYVLTLERLASEIGMSWVDRETILSDKQAAALILGYLRASGFKYVKPQDRGVVRNCEVLQHILNDNQELRSAADIKKARQLAEKTSGGNEMRPRNVATRMKRYLARFIPTA